MKDLYTTEDGIKEVVSMALDGKLFEPVTRQEDVVVHNYIVLKLNQLGLNNHNIKEIVEYALRLPEKKVESEGEKVAKRYFGSDLYDGLD